MELEQRIDAFAKLGSVLTGSANGSHTGLSNGIIRIIDDYHKHNPWFTPDNVRRAVKAIGDELTVENLTIWTKKYPAFEEERKPKNIAVIMAGNIPAVGFHDLLCVLITGNLLLAKTSSKDDLLLREIVSVLCEIEPGFSSSVRFIEGKLEGFDAVIATGSDNSARYFEYYFGRYPRLIRKNRTGIALLTGSESHDELVMLGEDVFSYFGLGCRNITKLYMPEGYDLTRLSGAWREYSGCMDHGKYASNYRYHRAVLTINHEKFTDTGFLLLRREPSLFSPVAVINYEETDPHLFGEVATSMSDSIQVITGAGHTPFGFAQKPKLWDYSDNIDTIGFLLK
jgi:hypothetical protein